MKARWIVALIGRRLNERTFAVLFQILNRMYAKKSLIMRRGAVLHL